MRKIFFILNEFMVLMRENKTYVLAPILIALALLSFLVYYVGPTAIVTFIYAGV
jgi:DUF917 family protein